MLAACSDSSDSDTELPPAALVPLPSRPTAPAAGSVCETSPEGVTTIERPMLPTTDGSPTFGYSFKLHPGTDPDAPTVIFLPGGPGETSISVERDPTLLPANFSLIQTDPRGVGCNAPESVDQYPSAFYDSSFIAGDVLAITEQIGLSNYVLYGISYGTLVATVAASRAEAEGFTRPRAVVLEGVLGEPFARDGQVEEVFQAQWRIVRDRLPDDIRAQLVTEPLPLGLSPEQWGGALTTMLSLGTVTPPVTVAESLLYSLSPLVGEEERASLRDTVLEVNEDSVDAFGWRMHEAVACHEIEETGFRVLALLGGELTVTETYCNAESLDRAYVARDWPITVPIYYFSGTDDPNTPPWQAISHFAAQNAAPRALVSIIGAGHNPVGFNMTDCQPALWTAMSSGLAFAEAVGTCTWPMVLTTATPGQ
jgi:proline iminopeptidase